MLAYLVLIYIAGSLIHQRALKRELRKMFTIYKIFCSTYKNQELTNTCISLKEKQINIHLTPLMAIFYLKSSWFYSNILLLYAIFQSYQWHHLTGITELVLIFFTNEYKNDHDKKVTSVLRRSDRKLFGGKFMHKMKIVPHPYFLKRFLSDAHLKDTNEILRIYK